VAVHHDLVDGLEPAERDIPGALVYQRLGRRDPDLPRPDGAVRDFPDVRLTEPHVKALGQPGNGGLRLVGRGDLAVDWPVVISGLGLAGRARVP
jgi:hypothetical protein